jgi:hypothetical protein
MMFSMILLCLDLVNGYKVIVTFELLFFNIFYLLKVLKKLFYSDIRSYFAYFNYCWWCRLPLMARLP